MKQRNKTMKQGKRKETKTWTAGKEKDKQTQRGHESTRQGESEIK